ANAAVRPDRDHYFGRIWRLQHKQAKTIEIPNLVKASPAELVKALDHPNLHVRMNAQRLIIEKAAVQPAEFSKAFVTNDRELLASPRWNVHWQWILRNLNIKQTGLPPELHGNPEVLKNSLRVEVADAMPANVARDAGGVGLGITESKASAALGQISNPSPRVSLDAILALTPFATDELVSA